MNFQKSIRVVALLMMVLSLSNTRLQTIAAAILASI